MRLNLKDEVLVEVQVTEYEPNSFDFIWSGSDESNPVLIHETMAGIEQDEDGDGVTDFFDKCYAIPDPDQLDTDGDGIGDACEKEEPIEPDPIPEPPLEQDNPEPGGVPEPVAEEAPEPPSTEPNPEPVVEEVTVIEEVPDVIELPEDMTEPPPEVVQPPEDANESDLNTEEDGLSPDTGIDGNTDSKDSGIKEKNKIKAKKTEK